MMRTIYTLLLLVAPLIAHADLNVFACEPEWAALAQEIGGELVKTSSATTALQDPHYIQARPSLISKVRRADLVLCSGAQLEIGWLPKLLQKANNRKVRPGTPGYLEASSFVVRLEIASNVDRSQGDIHPQGNPHIQSDPHNVAAVAKVLAKRMAEIDRDNATTYASRYEDFSDRWRQAIAIWEAKALPLKGMGVITHHKSWVYLENWLGLEEAGNLEAVPGLPPTATHLSRLMKKFGDGGADVIIRAPYQDGKPSEWLSERTGIPEIVLPFDDRRNRLARRTCFRLYEDIIERLLGVSE